MTPKVKWKILSASSGVGVLSSNNADIHDDDDDEDDDDDDADDDFAGFIVFVMRLLFSMFYLERLWVGGSGNGKWQCCCFGCFCCFSCFSCCCCCFIFLLRRIPGCTTCLVVVVVGNV